MTKNRLRKLAGVVLISTMALTTFTGCGSKDGDGKDAKITVVSREDGSGTRGAFVELVGIEKDKVDNTTPDANITNSTEVMLTSVSGDKNAIGYVSLGSLDDSVKAVKVAGVEATAENIKNKSYTISRPFNIATKGDVSALAQDYINFIMSADGQKVITDNGYVAIDDAATAFTSTNESGKIVVAGSSSVTPVMEKLKEAYLKVNTNAEVEIQESDSTAGMESVKSGTCDVGMASRELKDSETSEGITATAIAMDGIAVVVNKDLSVDDLTIDQIMKIFTGEYTKWSDVK